MRMLLRCYVYAWLTLLAIAVAIYVACMMTMIYAVTWM